MTRLNHVLKKLTHIESHLKKAGNDLWTINSALRSSLSHGHQPDDFLPRRLACMKKETQNTVTLLVEQFHAILATHFDKRFVAFKSPDDIKTIHRIRKTVRYLYNGFSNDLPVHEALTHLNALLPLPSKKMRS